MKNINSVTIAGILVGTILEWYDFSLLGSLAPVISSLFFPSESATLSLLATFGVFATGFIARPIGGLIFGHVGDRKGRRNALSLSIVLMAIPTTLIGCLPVYHSAGITASIMLISLRFMQGIASSGEYPGAICILTEMAPENRRGFYGSLSMLGVAGGVFLGSTISSVLTIFLSNEQIYSWGWRIPFLLGMPLGIIGWILRYNAPESATFKSSLKSKFPIKEIIQFNAVNLSKIILLFSLSTISFYMGFVYIVGYLISTHKITLQQGFIDNAISTICLALLIPVFGYLSDKMNKKHLMLTGAVGLLGFYYPIFILFTMGNPTTLLIGQLMLAVLIAIFVGPLAALTAETFTTSTRYSGISAGINIGATIFGGTCPLVAAYMVQQTGNANIPSYYPISIAFICVFIIYTLNNNYSSAFIEVTK